MRGLPSVEALEGAHEFPCRYTFKAFGPAEQSFVDAARSAVEDTTAGQGDLELTARLSSKGSYMCVTLDVRAQSADQVRAIYIELGKLDGLRMLL